MYPEGFDWERPEIAQNVDLLSSCLNAHGGSCTLGTQEIPQKCRYTSKETHQYQTLASLLCKYLPGETSHQIVLRPRTDANVVFVFDMKGRQISLRSRSPILLDGHDACPEVVLVTILT